MTPAAAVTLVAAAVLAGCGGGTKSAPVTASTTVGPNAKQVALLQYLSRSTKALKPYRAAHALDVRAEKLVVGRVSTQAERKMVARDLNLAAARVELSAVKQLQAQPPAALRGINRRFAQLSTRIGSQYRDLAVAAAASDWPASWNQMIVKDPADVDARSEWRVEVIAYANEIGVPVPGWLKTIGTPYTKKE